MSLRPTLAAPHRFEIEIKKSRFIAQAAPASDVAAALAFIAGASDADARHNCWAYRIGELYRFDDADEPAGTAGRPILAAIDGQGLDLVAVVVTRWFGGIKLGAGGLVRAYGGAAAECLRTAERLERVAMQAAEISAGFAHLGTVHALIDALAAEKNNEAFDADGVTLQINVRADQIDRLGIALRDATRGQATLRLLD
ncbi:MAG: YigZ family protein [Rhodanobacteraceae bacterium]|nr:YigZ family protein [Rhodanobacteraceae bacterium]MBL0041403.1 YigZ family protein [Xanthomonadales bacterium]MBP6077385.1 YigZ family protein [Xanthomonadales bacterium]MBP7622455.1 YigZ family protein [Xanthomonadales bacterium]